MIVVGAGAAGLLAALYAARGGARTVLLEGSSKAGAKILISGGGRCNVLPGIYDPAAFFTCGSRNVLKRLFRTWPLEQVRAFFEDDLQLPLQLEEDSGKLFPVAQRALVVRDALMQAVLDAGAEVRLNWRVQEIKVLENADTRFRLTAEDGQRLHARRVVMATGGQSVPQTGSDGHGYALMRACGHSVLPIYPALVPLTTADRDWPRLAGVSCRVAWRALVAGKEVDRGRGPLLFTHQGWSGPAALDASHWFEREGAVLVVAWDACTREEWSERIRTSSRREIGPCLADHLPRRLAEELLRRADVPVDQVLAQLPRGARERLLDQLSACRLEVNGSRGFRVAEVTGGGIPLSEVNPSTLESRVQPGLFLCGEILDVIGRIGGHNFLWAWITGRLAGASAARG